MHGFIALTFSIQMKQKLFLLVRLLDIKNEH